MQTCLNRLPTISRRNEPRNGTMIPSFASWTTGLPSRMRDRNCNPASKTCAARDPAHILDPAFAQHPADPSHVRPPGRFGIIDAAALPRNGTFGPVEPGHGRGRLRAIFPELRALRCGPGRRRGQGFVEGGCSDAARFSRFCGLTWIRPQRGLSMSAIRKNEIERMKGMTIRSRRSRSNVFEV